MWACAKSTGRFWGKPKLAHVIILCNFAYIREHPVPSNVGGRDQAYPYHMLLVRFQYAVLYLFVELFAIQKHLYREEK